MKIALIFSIIFFIAYFFSHEKIIPEYGFDISHYQGTINWDKIPKTYNFVYIKATQGTNHLDPLYNTYWQQAQQHKLLVGAYHFFEICEDGQAQANQFIHNVPITPNMLAPAIDLEYDPRCTKNKDKILKEINTMYNLLAIHYQQAPIFYTSNNFYNIVLKGHFKNVPLWIRDYHKKPSIPYLYWQYTNLGKINGINTPVDLNQKNSTSNFIKQFFH